MGLKNAPLWREIIKGPAIKNVVCGKDLRPLPIKVQLKGGQAHLHKNRRSIAVWTVWLVECETASQSSVFWCTLHAKTWLNAANENVPDTTLWAWSNCLKRHSRSNIQWCFTTIQMCVQRVDSCSCYSPHYFLIILRFKIYEHVPPKLPYFSKNQFCFSALASTSQHLFLLSLTLKWDFLSLPSHHVPNVPPPTNTPHSSPLDVNHTPSDMPQTIMFISKSGDSSSGFKTQSKLNCNESEPNQLFSRRYIKPSVA